MSRRYPCILAAFLILSWAGSALAQEGLTEQDVQAAMEAPAFTQAFNACFAGEGQPTEVTLVLIIGDKGAATLSKTDPVLQAATYACVQQAVAKLAFPATGYNFEITYPMTVAAAGGPAAGTAHPTTTATPVYAVQPTMVVVQDDSWKTLYSEGRRSQIAGGILLGVGGVVLALPGLILMSWGAACVTGMSTIGAEAVCTPLTVVGGVMLAGGAIMMIIGIVKLARGARLKRKALQMKTGTGWLPSLDLALSHDARGGALALTWHF
jgi:hypothetical protein